MPYLPYGLTVLSKKHSSFYPPAFSFSFLSLLFHISFIHPQQLFSLSSFPHLNLAIIFLSFALSLPRYFGISSVIHLSYSLILSLHSCLSVSLYLLFSSTFIHLPFALNLSTSSSPCSFSFHSSIPLVSCTLSFHPFCPQTLPLSFTLSFSAYSSYTLPSLCNLTFLCPLLAPLSNIFLALFLPLLVPSIPTFLPRTIVHQYTL
jgi:hypothetical protein